MTSADSNAKGSEEYEDEFDEYLKTQCMKTTFNGLELESFTWYTKMLGIK